LLHQPKDGLKDGANVNLAPSQSFQLKVAIATNGVEPTLALHEWVHAVAASVLVASIVT
jgi:hypothetical protein